MSKDETPNLPERIVIRIFDNLRNHPYTHNMMKKLSNEAQGKLLKNLTPEVEEMLKEMEEQFMQEQDQKFEDLQKQINELSNSRISKDDFGKLLQGQDQKFEDVQKKVSNLRNLVNSKASRQELDEIFDYTKELHQAQQFEKDIPKLTKGDSVSLIKDPNLQGIVQSVDRKDDGAIRVTWDISGPGAQGRREDAIEELTLLSSYKK